MKSNDKANFVIVLDTLKRNGCISGYTIDDNSIVTDWPDWLPGGAERALAELLSGKPFGMKRKFLSYLLVVLPKEQRDKFLDKAELRLMAQRSALLIPCRLGRKE